jgi:hypothetical protein
MFDMLALSRLVRNTCSVLCVSCNDIQGGTARGGTRTDCHFSSVPLDFDLMAQIESILIFFCTMIDFLAECTVITLAKCE